MPKAVVLSGRVEAHELMAFHDRVAHMKPKRSASVRIQQLVQADLKKWRKGVKR